MPSPLRPAAALALAVLVSLPGAIAQTAPADELSAGASLDARLAALLARPGGRTSFDVRARRDELAAAAAGVEQAWVAYLPRLTLNARYNRLSPLDPARLGTLVAAPGTSPGVVPQGATLVSVPLTIPFVTDSFVTQATLSIPLTDYLVRVPQAVASSREAQRAADASARATALRVASEGRVAYYSWARARLQTAVAEQARAQAQAHLTDVRHAFDAGSASRADVLRVESQVASAELLIERAQSLDVVTADRLRTAMHQQGMGELAIGEDVRGDPPALAGADALEPLVDEAYGARFELRALTAQSSSLRSAASGARAARYPRLDALGDVTYANPNPRVFPQSDTWTATWSVGVALSWSPNDLAAAAAAGRGADARASAVEAQREAVRDGVRAEVVGAWQAVREARAAVASTARSLAAAEEGYRVRRALFREGRATTAERIDSETDLTRASLEAINARIDQRVARVRLEHAAGRDAASAEGAR
jgi:outer membrane protein